MPHEIHSGRLSEAAVGLAHAIFASFQLYTGSIFCTMLQMITCGFTVALTATHHENSGRSFGIGKLLPQRHDLTTALVLQLLEPVAITLSFQQLLEVIHLLAHRLLEKCLSISLTLVTFFFLILLALQEGNVSSR